MDIRYLHAQAPGDIIFVRPRKVSVSSKANRSGQTLVTLRKARYSHVLLCVVPGLYIHSEPESGVTLVLAESEEADFPAVCGPHWEVRRNRHLSMELRAKVGFRAQYYLGQPYNYAFLAGGPLFRRWRIGHSFCSELIARVYDDLGLSITERSHEKVLPVHLELSTRDKTIWENVTDQYMECFRDEADPRATPGDAAGGIEIADPRKMYIAITSHLIDSAKLAVQMTHAGNELTALLQEHRSTLQEMPEGERRELARALGMNLESYRNLRESLIDSLCAIDSALSDDLTDASPPSIHWIQDMGPKLAKPSYSDSLRDYKESVEAFLKVVEEGTKTIELGTLNLLQLFGLRLQQKEDTGAIDEAILGIESVLTETLDAVEAFENYGDDLQWLESRIGELTKNQPLRIPECRDVLASISKEVFLRSVIHNRIRPCVMELSQSPFSNDPLLRLSNVLIEIEAQRSS